MRPSPRPMIDARLPTVSPYCEVPYCEVSFRGPTPLLFVDTVNAAGLLELLTTLNVPASTDWVVDCPTNPLAIEQVKSTACPQPVGGGTEGGVTAEVVATTKAPGTAVLAVGGVTATTLNAEGPGVLSPAVTVGSATPTGYKLLN